MSGKGKHNLLSIVNVGNQFETVEHEKCLHCCMSNSFVAVDERVVHDDGETKRCCLCLDCGIEFLTAESHLRLCDTRPESSHVANAAGAAGFCDHKLMYMKYL